MKATAKRIRCSGHSSRTGAPCKRWATNGATVCRAHGAAAPQVRKSAAERLAELVDPAINTLRELLASTRDDVRLGAAKDLLDRNGHKTPDKVDVNASVEHRMVVDDASALLLADLIAAGLTARSGNPAQGG